MFGLVVAGLAFSGQCWLFSFNTAESYSWHTGRNWNYFWKFWTSLKYSMNISPNFSSKIDNSALLRVGRFHRKIFSGPSNAFIGKIFGKNILQILRTSYTEGKFKSVQLKSWKSHFCTVTYDSRVFRFIWQKALRVLKAVVASFSTLSAVETN